MRVLFSCCLEARGTSPSVEGCPQSLEGICRFLATWFSPAWLLASLKPANERHSSKKGTESYVIQSCNHNRPVTFNNSWLKASHLSCLHSRESHKTWAPGKRGSQGLPKTLSTIQPVFQLTDSLLTVPF